MWICRCIQTQFVFLVLSHPRITVCIWIKFKHKKVFKLARSHSEACRRCNIRRWRFLWAYQRGVDDEKVQRSTLRAPLETHRLISDTYLWDKKTFQINFLGGKFRNVFLKLFRKLFVIIPGIVQALYWNYFTFLKLLLKHQSSEPKFLKLIRKYLFLVQKVFLSQRYSSRSVWHAPSNSSSYGGICWGCRMQGLHPRDRCNPCVVDSKIYLAL